MKSTQTYLFIGTLTLVLLCASSVSAQGIVLPSGGAINGGMGGATTGAAIDALGSMYWNPATISDFDRDEIGFGFQLVVPNQNISSSFPGSGIGPGSTDSKTGAIPVPTIAWVHQTSHSDVKFGFGVFGSGGFSLNMPADPTNPILSPPPSLNGVGVGGIRAEAQYFQLAPALSLQLTDRLSMGFGPTIGMGRLTFDENSFVAPNGDGRYPRGDGTRFHWGLGAQLGFHYIHNCCWEFGANFKSPVWFESLEYFSEDENGLPRTDKIDFDLPMILSGGLAYKGFEHVIVTTDLRYFNYSAADGFGDSPSYRADGSVNGLGWDDILALGLGAQAQLSERITGRVGYVFASELFNKQDTFFNVGADLSYQHTITTGGSYQLSDHVLVSGAYNYILPYQSSGTYIFPGAGAIAGTNVSSDFNVHFATVGLNVRY